MTPYFFPGFENVVGRAWAVGDPVGSDRVDLVGLDLVDLVGSDHVDLVGLDHVDLVGLDRVDLVGLDHVDLVGSDRVDPLNIVETRHALSLQYLQYLQRRPRFCHHRHLFHRGRHFYFHHLFRYHSI